MTDVPSRLTTLIEHLTSLGSPFGRYMRPGRSDADVRAAVASFGLAPPTELIDWFGQFDGPDDDAFQRADEQASALELFPGVRPLTLDQACELATELRAAAEDLGEDAEQFWRPNWFPIMVGPGSIFAVDCGPGAGAEEAQVWRSLSHPGPSETGRVAGTLSEFLHRWIGELQAGSAYWHTVSRSLQPTDGEAVRLEAAGLY